MQAFTDFLLSERKDMMKTENDSSKLGQLIAQQAADALVEGYKLLQLKDIPAAIPEGEGLRAVCWHCAELARRMPMGQDMKAVEYAVMLASVAAYLVQAPKTFQGRTEGEFSDLNYETSSRLVSEQRVNTNRRGSVEKFSCLNSAEKPSERVSEQFSGLNSADFRVGKRAEGGEGSSDE
jgi:Flp pilus assembly pilin Flp